MLVYSPSVSQVERNINAVHRDHMAAVESSLADAREEVADRDAKLAQVCRPITWRCLGHWSTHVGPLGVEGGRGKFAAIRKEQRVQLLA